MSEDQESTPKTGNTIMARDDQEMLDDLKESIPAITGKLADARTKAYVIPDSECAL